MTADYDPKLQALFARAELEFDRESFTRDIMREIDRQRRQTVLVWSGIGILAVVVFAFLASPVMAALGMATQLLPNSLVNIETEWLGLLLSPINSVAATIALGFLGVRRFFRNIFR